MCGRFTVKATWAELVALYRLTMDRPPHNLQLRYNGLIPMSGYYEWKNTTDGKQPWYFTARDGSPALTAAGLWDEWKNRETGERLKSCTMIVTAPNEFAAEIHDRMPAFLTSEQFEPWLSGEAGVEFLKPVPNDFLQRWPVSMAGLTHEQAVEYVADAHELTTRDLRALRKEIALWRRVYNERYRDVRHKVFAHKELSDIDEVNKLLAKTNVDEMKKLFAFLSAVYSAFWELFYNGREPVLSPHTFVLPPKAGQEKSSGETVYVEGHSALMSML
jgi:putative SOS response-associated peptidase YedK